MVIGWAQHPDSGERFAAEVDMTGKVLALAGAIYQPDKADICADDVLSNNIVHSEDDAEWWNEQMSNRVYTFESCVCRDCFDAR